MLFPVLALKVTLLGAKVKESVPCSTVSVIDERLDSLSVTDNSLVPVKSTAVLIAVLTDVVLVELMAVALKWLIGASLVPVTVMVSVFVLVAPLVSLTS